MGRARFSEDQPKGSEANASVRHKATGAWRPQVRACQIQQPVPYTALRTYIRNNGHGYGTI